MICWWCGKKLTNIFGKPVEGEEIEIPGHLVASHRTRVHKVCAHDAKSYLKDIKVTARPTGDTLA